MPLVYLCDKCRAYTPNQVILCPKCASDAKELAEPAHNNESDAILQRYNELLFAVGQKYPNETRHQTALRYIQQAEQFDNGGVVKQAHVS